MPDQSLPAWNGARSSGDPPSSCMEKRATRDERQEGDQVELRYAEARSHYIPCCTRCTLPPLAPTLSSDVRIRGWVIINGNAITRYLQFGHYNLYWVARRSPPSLGQDGHGWMTHGSLRSARVGLLFVIVLENPSHLRVKHPRDMPPLNLARGLFLSPIRASTSTSTYSRLRAPASSLIATIPRPRPRQIPFSLQPTFHRSFHPSRRRSDVFFVAFPALKSTLLGITRASLLILPFVFRYK